jgi:rhodanese-related sulfurtransferase
MPMTADDLLATARSRIARLDPGAAHEASRRGALIVDSRCAAARRADGIIPGSTHVPLSVLPWRFDPASPHRDPSLADPSREVIVVCDHGFSSSLAAAWLRDLGYEHVGDVVGGFEAWAAAGLPVAPEADPPPVAAAGLPVAPEADPPPVAAARRDPDAVDGAG